MSSSYENMNLTMEFLLSLCRQLLACGCSANRVEKLCYRIARRFNMQIEVIATPTGVWISIRKFHRRVTDLTRVHKWSTDLNKLVTLDDLVARLEKRSISLEEAIVELRQIARAQLFSPKLVFLAWCGASSSLVWLRGGDWREILLAAPLGGIVSLLSHFLVKTDYRRHLSDFSCAAFVAFYSFLCHLWLESVDVARLTVGGIIILVPGLTLVNGVHEIAQKNLVSGTAKLVEAFLIALSLVLGVTVSLTLCSYFKF